MGRFTGNSDSDKYFVEGLFFKKLKSYHYVCNLKNTRCKFKFVGKEFCIIVDDGQVVGYANALMVINSVDLLKLFKTDRSICFVNTKLGNVTPDFIAICDKKQPFGITKDGKILTFNDSCLCIDSGLLCVLEDNGHVKKTELGKLVVYDPKTNKYSILNSSYEYLPFVFNSSNLKEIKVNGTKAVVMDEKSIKVFGKNNKYITLPLTAQILSIENDEVFIVKDKGYSYVMGGKSGLEVLYKTKEDIDNVKKDIWSKNMLVLKNGSKCCLVDITKPNKKPVYYSNIYEKKVMHSNKENEKAYTDVFVVEGANKKVGLLDEHGNVILPAEYDNISLEHSYARNGVMNYLACKNGKWGIVDETGKIVVDFKYTNLYNDKDIFSTSKRYITSPRTVINDHWAPRDAELFENDFYRIEFLDENGKSVYISTMAKNPVLSQDEWKKEYTKYLKTHEEKILDDDDDFYRRNRGSSYSIPTSAIGFGLIISR